MCVFTVVGLRNRRSASSALLRPVASRRRTSSSRGVRPDRSRCRVTDRSSSRWAKRSISRMGDRGREQGVAGLHQAYGAHQMLGGDVLEQEAAGGGERGVDVVVEVVGGEDDDPRPVGAVAVEDPPGRLDAVHPRHPDVHEDDVGPGTPDGRDRLGPVGRLGRHLDAVGGEDHPEARTHQGLVVRDDGTQGRPLHAVRHGTRALIRYPPHEGRSRREFAAVHREPLTQPDQPAAGAVGRRGVGVRGRGVVGGAGVHDLDLQTVAACSRS